MGSLERACGRSRSLVWPPTVWREGFDLMPDGKRSPMPALLCAALAVAIVLSDSLPPEAEAARSAAGEWVVDAAIEVGEVVARSQGSGA